MRNKYDKVFKSKEAIEALRREKILQELSVSYYEDILLNGYETMIELKEGIKRCMKFYNSERFYQSLDYATPG